MLKLLVLDRIHFTNFSNINLTEREGITWWCRSTIRRRRRHSAQRMRRCSQRRQRRRCSGGCGVGVRSSLHFLKQLIWVGTFSPPNGNYLKKRVRLVYLIDINIFSFIWKRCSNMVFLSGKYEKLGKMWRKSTLAPELTYAPARILF